jgi:hypothetical protein
LRHHSDATPKVGNVHPAPDASLDKQTTSARPIYVVQDSKPVSSRYSGCKNVLTFTVIREIVLHYDFLSLVCCIPFIMDGK